MRGLERVVPSGTHGDTGWCVFHMSQLILDIENDRTVNGLEGDLPASRESSGQVLRYCLPWRNVDCVVEDGIADEDEFFQCGSSL